MVPAGNLGLNMTDMTIRFLLRHVDRGAILLVVCSAFGAATVNGLWHRVGAGDVAVMAGLSVAALGIVMTINIRIARMAGLPREDMAVLAFCGSKKSLVAGVPIASALFASAQVGIVVLPLMIFHQIQLFLCAILAARMRNRTPEAKA